MTALDLLHTSTAIFAILASVIAAKAQIRLREVRGYVARLQRWLGDALEEADTHKAALDVVNAQRAQALEKARQANLARKAQRAAKDAAKDAERRDNTLKALPGLSLRPRDEVVAEVIRERTGV